MSFGEGHRTAARNLSAALTDMAAEQGVEVQYVDTLMQRHPTLGKWVSKGYEVSLKHLPWLWGQLYDRFDRSKSRFGFPYIFLITLRRAFAKLLKETQPIAIVLTHPAYGYALDEFVSHRKIRGDMPRFMVVTDSVSVNSIWLRCHSDFYFVSNEATAIKLRRSGVAEEKIKVFGFPVDPRFSELREEALRVQLRQRQWKVLVVLSSYPKPKACALVKELLDCAAIGSLTIVAGKDQELYCAVEKVVKRAASSQCVTLRGWVNDMPHLLMTHHLVVSKAGGAIVQEAIAAGCPMIINKIVPGQEEGNAGLIVENDLGRVALREEIVVQTIEAATSDNGRLWQAWANNMAQLQIPHATEASAEFIMQTVMDLTARYPIGLGV